MSLRTPIFCFAVAAAARALLLFGTELVPGTNGAYYLVQARTLLVEHRMAFPDLPLAFVLQALVAGLLNLLGMQTDAAVLLAVKCCDVLLPALAVFPVLALAAEKSAFGAPSKASLVIALLTAAGAPALQMVGDFQKNSFGLTLLCFLVWRIVRWLRTAERRDALAAVGFGSVLAFVHIGVFGTALLFCVFTLVGATIWQRSKVWGLGGLVVVLLAAFALAGLWFDPARGERLLGAFTAPARFLESGMFVPAPGSWSPWVESLLFALVPCVLLAREWRGGDWVFAAALAAVVICLTGPWAHGDKLMRFQFNAVPLCLMAGVCVAEGCPIAFCRHLTAGLAMVLLAVPAAPRLLEGGKPILTVEAARELAGFANGVHHPSRTLIVARHGLEWWAAWYLRTRVCQAYTLEAEDWQRYHHVWLLHQHSGQARSGVFGRSPFCLPWGPEAETTAYDSMPQPGVPVTLELLYEGSNFSLYLLHLKLEPKTGG